MTAPTDTTGVPARPWRRSSRGVVLGVVLLVAIALPFFRGLPAYNYVLQLGIVLFMWIAMTSSWNIVGGFAGYISLGHNVFYGIGGYLSGLLLVYAGWSPFATAVLAGLFCLALGVGFGLVTFRAHGPAFIISTIALLLMVTIFFDNWEFVGGSNGISMPLPPFPVEWIKVPFYYAMLVSAVGSVYLAYRIAHSKFGLGLRALAQDETKAEVAGIDTRRFKIAAFALSAFFVGVVGAVWAYSLSYLRPTIFFIIGVAANMVLMAIIGGRGTVAGPVVGAIVLIAVNELSVVLFGASELNIVVTGVILLGVLLFFPLGIVGTLREHGKLPAILDWD